MTGQPAFAADNTPQIMFDIVYKMPKRPGAVTKALPSDVDRVMAIALAKDPDDRFQSAVELADAFAQACSRRLAPELRHRGDALTQRCPWGSTIAARSGAGDEQHLNSP
jgi:serine/threonine-protein kinase